MQIRIFTIPILDNEATEAKLNQFLRGNKILEVEQSLVEKRNETYWCFCVRYLERNATSPKDGKKRIDYREVLDEVTFQRFSKLREVRKKIAVKDGVPIYMVFTNDELASIAQLSKITTQTIKEIKGIGKKKVEKYGQSIIDSLNS
ncbi:MAG: HRDC domain-containing protein [Saprospiraceae bacterium]